MKKIQLLLLFIFVGSALAIPSHKNVQWVNIGEGTYDQGFLFPYKVKLFVPFGIRDIQDIKNGVIPMKFELDWLLMTAAKEQVMKIFSNQIKEHYDNPEDYRLAKNIINQFLDKLPAVNKHDIWVFEFYPDTGTLLYIKDKKIHHLVGAEFNRALQQSWLDKNPVLTSNLFTRLLQIQ
jgi:hypothetical protein